MYEKLQTNTRVDTKLDYTVHVFTPDTQVLLSMGLLEWSARTARGLK